MQLSGQFYRTVIVAVITVGMMQVPIDQVIDVVAVGDSRVATARAVYVACFVARAIVRLAPVRVAIRDLDGVFVVVIFVGAMQVPVMQVTHVIAMLDGDMAAVWPMGVVVVFVDLAAHGSMLPT